MSPDSLFMHCRRFSGKDRSCQIGNEQLVGSFSFKMSAAPPSYAPFFPKPDLFHYRLDSSSKEQGLLLVIHQFGIDLYFLCCRSPTGREHILRSSDLSRQAEQELGLGYPLAPLRSWPPRSRIQLLFQSESRYLPTCHSRAQYRIHQEMRCLPLSDQQLFS